MLKFKRNKNQEEFKIIADPDFKEINNLALLQAEKQRVETINIMLDEVIPLKTVLGIEQPDVNQVLVYNINKQLELATGRVILTMPISYLLHEDYVDTIIDTLNLSNKKVAIELVYESFDGKLKEHFGYKDYDAYSLKIMSNSGYKRFIDAYNYLKELGFDNFIFDDATSIETFMFVNEKIIEYANMINESKFLNRNLSLLERYLFAYKFLSKAGFREITKALNIEYEKAKLSIKDISKLCTLHAQLLSELCNKIGILCATQVLKNASGHDYSCVGTYIYDETYHIHKVVCGDCFKDYLGSNKNKLLVENAANNYMKAIYNFVTNGYHNADVQAIYQDIISQQLKVMTNGKTSSANIEYLKTIKFPVSHVDFIIKDGDYIPLITFLTANAIVNKVMNPKLEPNEARSKSIIDYGLSLEEYDSSTFSRKAESTEKTDDEE